MKPQCILIKYSVHGWCNCMQWIWAIDALDDVELPPDYMESSSGIVFIP